VLITKSLIKPKKKKAILYFSFLFQKYIKKEMNQFSGMLNIDPQKLFVDITTTTLPSDQSSTFKIEPTTSSIAYPEVTTPTPVFARVENLMQTLYTNVMESEQNNLTALLMLLLFSTFLYTFSKKCYSYYR